MFPLTGITAPQLSPDPNHRCEAHQLELLTSSHVFDYRCSIDGRTRLPIRAAKSDLHVRRAVLTP